MHLNISRTNIFGQIPPLLIFSLSFSLVDDTQLIFSEDRENIYAYVSITCPTYLMLLFEGDIGNYGMAILAYFSYGIFLEKLRYYVIGNLTVHSICNFGLKNCCN